MIRFKSFKDYFEHKGGLLLASKQIEDFIVENKILDNRIKGIKFCADGNGDAHILLIYCDVEEV